MHKDSEKIIQYLNLLVYHAFLPLLEVQYFLLVRVIQVHQRLPKNYTALKAMHKGFVSNQFTLFRF